MNQRVVDKYRLIDSKEFMTLDEAVVLAERLANDHKGTGVDLVVGVPNGGLLPSGIVAEVLGVPLELISVRRKGSAIKSRLSKYGWIKRFVSAWYAIPVVRYPLYKVMEYMSSLSDDVPVQAGRLNGAARILVVDDSLDTGQSLERVLEIVRSSAPQATVRTAVLCVETKIPDGWRRLDPDYYLCPRMQHFPWSVNSPEYERYLDWLRERNLYESQVG